MANALDVLAGEIGYNVNNAEFAAAQLKYKGVTIPGLMGPAARRATGRAPAPRPTRPKRKSIRDQEIT